jgi:glycosyltransferase involved in cell wall biosynthesis
MKILILYPTVFPDFIGGVEHRNHELAAALARRGHEVTLAAFCRSEEGARAGNQGPRLAVLSLGPLQGLYNEAGQRSTYQALRFAATTLASRRLDLSAYDVVETASVPYIHLLPLALRCRLAGKPLVVTWYEYWGAYWRRYVGRAKAPVYAAIEWLTGQLGDAVTATSRLTEERLRGRRGRSGVELIPCGIRLEEVQRAARLGERRHGQGVPLVFAGRLLREKRVDLLLRAVALLETGRPPGVLLRVFGEGPARPDLGRLAAELGIAERVEFRGHVAGIAEVWADLGAAKAAVQPSEREGFGLFPLEAMAAGVPVVYCDSPESAVPELVRHGLDGFGVPPKPRALASALAHLIDDEAEWRRLQAHALERAREYDWDAIAGQIEKTCERLVR